MYFVQIRRNADGVVRLYKHDFPWEEGSDYLWGEGNYSCDCNRALWFAWDAGEGYPDQECGYEAFSVRILNAGAGELYRDHDWDEILIRSIGS